MRLLVTCQPAIGHFHAVAPLALAARDAGHEVLVATGRGLGEWVGRAGLEVREMGPPWLADGPRPGAFTDPRRRLRLMSLATGALISDLMTAIDEFGPDVVLHESLEWSAPLAADARGVPYAALGQLPRLPRPLLAERLGPVWTAARDRLGLPPDPGLERLHPYLYLDAYVPSMQPLAADPLSWFGAPATPDVGHLVAPPRFTVAAPRPDWLDRLPHPRTVYVTMGTAFNQTPELFGTVIRALAAEPVNVVMTVGSGVDAAPLRALAANVRVETYVPQEEMLRAADALIQHAGYLTTVGALAHGLPSVVIPVAVDQPYHAHRLAAAGAAVHLDHLALTVDDVRRATRAVLDDPLYRANARRLQAEVLAMPPLGRGVELLETLARTGRPVVAGFPEKVAG